jgi:hypothetical protein
MGATKHKMLEDRDKEWEEAVKGLWTECSKCGTRYPVKWGEEYGCTFCGPDYERE